MPPSNIFMSIAWVYMYPSWKLNKLTKNKLKKLQEKRRKCNFTEYNQKHDSFLYCKKNSQNYIMAIIALRRRCGYFSL